jgi:hypothetical protein
MTFRPRGKKIVSIAAMALNSCVASLLTMFFIVESGARFRTLGMFLTSLTDLPLLSPLKGYLLAFAVDSIFYFVLILAVAALFNRRYGKSRETGSLPEPHLGAWPSLAKTLLHIAFAALFAGIAVWETDIAHDPQIQTPGIFVSRLLYGNLDPAHMSLGLGILVEFSVDLIVYFSVVWNLLALVRWWLGKRQRDS